MDEKPKNQINIELTDEMASGIYSNLAIITHSPTEFVLDFVSLMPGAPKDFWAATLKFAPGKITLPDGKAIETPDDFVKFSMVFDPANGAFTADADGKSASGKAGTLPAKAPGIFFGDGSSGISGSAELKSIRFRLL